MENLEIRSFGGEASPKLVSERTIEGYAVVVGQESKYMYDPVLRKCFIEIIEVGAVDEELIKRSDIWIITVWDMLWTLLILLMENLPLKW